MTREESVTRVKRELGKKLQKSVFYPEEGYENCKKTRRNKGHPWALRNRGLKAPSANTWSLAERLRTIKQLKVEDEMDEMNDLKRSGPESRDIETVQKENFFDKEITEEEHNIIAKRIALQQRQFAAYEQREKARKTAKIKTLFDYLTEQEIEELLKECNHDEDEAVSRLIQPGVLKNIRKKIALKYEDETKENHLPTVDQLVIHQQLARRRSKRNTTIDEKKKYHLVSKLCLDDAVQQCTTQVDPKKAFEGWSDARINAYKNIGVNANRFYYRFNAPGETQRTGPWNEDEKELFLARLAELDRSDNQTQVQWGIFSMGIPGRVGYQCASHYRQLVEKREIVDPNYVLDDKNKARFLFARKDANGKIQRTIRTFKRNRIPTFITSEQFNEPPSSSATATTRSRTRAGSKKNTTITAIKKSTTNKENAGKLPVKTSRAAAAGSRKRRRSQGRRRTDDDDDDDKDDSGNFTSRGRIVGEPRKTARRRCPTKTASKMGLEEKGLDEDDVDCPLPGFLDPITLEQVVNPAISKYGHVMGYDSWIRCLHKTDGPRDICPLTKKQLTKRDLVILTSENFDEYKDKIVM